MEDLSLYTGSGRWFLSWKTEAVVLSSPPTPLQSDTSFETGVDLHGSLDAVGVAVPAIFQPDYENGIDGEMFYLTGQWLPHWCLLNPQVRIVGITVIYTEGDGTDSAATTVEVSKLVIFAGDHIWALQASGTSPNRWEFEADVDVAM